MADDFLEPSMATKHAKIEGRRQCSSTDPVHFSSFHVRLGQLRNLMHHSVNGFSAVPCEHVSTKIWDLMKLSLDCP